MALFRRSRICRLVGSAVILCFVAGCFMAISSLMRVDSLQEAEVARHAIHLAAKKGSSRLQDAGQDTHQEQGPDGNGLPLLEPERKRPRSDVQIHGDTARKNKTINSVHGAEQERAPGIQGAEKVDSADSAQWPTPNYNVHAFYYPWYGNPEFDGQYLHWNHEILPHWNKKEARKWASGRWQPPGEIGANFYPQLGCYSSRDPATIEDHMQQLRLAGIGVLAMSWYPAGLSDLQGKPSDDLMPVVLDAAHKYGLKVTFHSEPYKGRTEVTFLEDIRYIVNKYGSHPAFYRHRWKGRLLPMFYVYDSYLTNATKWAKVFGINDALSVRNTKYDGIFLGLYVDAQHKADIVTSGFDGFYTYFASNGFTFGSRWKNWKLLADFGRKRGLLFVPSVGPGYIDTQVRPWNQMNTKNRNNGDYYDRSFQAALNAKPSLISVTSFNEWHEGTQIETAVPKTHRNLTYMDYGLEGPNKYLLQTQKWSKIYRP